MVMLLHVAFWWRDALPRTNQLGLGEKRWSLENSESSVVILKVETSTNFKIVIQDLKMISNNNLPKKCRKKCTRFVVKSEGGVSNVFLTICLGGEGQ